MTLQTELVHGITDPMSGVLTYEQVQKRHCIEYHHIMLA